MSYFQLPKFNLPSKLHAGIGILLLLGATPMPYGYYTFLRIVVCGFSAITSYHNFNLEDGDKSFWSWLYLFIAIIFNPLVVIHMSKDVWMFADVSLGILFFLTAHKVSVLEKNMLKIKKGDKR
ncbi:MAG: hypothetical protein KA100_02110 [Rickettsiales bacterium]|nr:hypothetical protein [Rickettsiales bacterium]